MLIDSEEQNLKSNAANDAANETTETASHEDRIKEILDKQAEDLGLIRRDNLGPHGRVHRTFGGGKELGPPVICNVVRLVPKEPVMFTVIENEDGLAVKVFSGQKPNLKKRSAAQVTNGNARRKSIHILHDLSAGLARMQNRHSLTFGVPEKDAPVVTQKALKSGKAPAGAIARDRKHWTFLSGRAGIMMLDFDPRGDGHAARTWQQLDDIMAKIVPGWKSFHRLWRPSASAFINWPDGTEAIGVGGWRAYVIVDNAAAIPMVIAFIHQEAWKIGEGYIKISESGALLDRSIIDASVAQPERLDFAGPPVMEDGLTRHAPPDVILGHKRLRTYDLTAMWTLPEWRLRSPELFKAKDLAKPEAARVRAAYIAKRLAKLKAQHPNDDEADLLRTLKQAVEHNVLMADYELTHEDGTKVTVGELLADPAKWNHARFYDPIETDHADSDPRIAYVNLTGKPYLWSHIHGGTRYELVRKRRAITVRGGNLPDIVDECLAVMREAGEMFDYGGELTQLLKDGGQLPVTASELLDDYLGRRIRFQKYLKTQNKEVPVDVPDKLSSTIIKKGGGERGLPKLMGIITAPTLREDGSLLCEPGYDPASGLLLLGDDFPAIPAKLDDDGLKAAYRQLWKPFEKFPYDNSTSRGVMLALLLTAPVRRTLPLAPGFNADAPMAGTGKTLLMQSVMRLAGVVPSVMPSTDGDEREFKKTLLGTLREGVAAFLIDNATGIFESNSFEAFFTSQFYKDRLLGVSKITPEYPTNVLALISGNNLILGGTLWRRVLTVRIDDKSDAPERRSFDLNPREYCRIHRQQMVAAALSILRTFIAEGKPRQTKDNIGSFEDWSSLIRECVVWLGAKGIAENVSDPGVSLIEAKEATPRLNTLAVFHTGIENAFPLRYSDDDPTIKTPREWKVADVIMRYEKGEKDSTYRNDELREALNEVAVHHGKVDADKLGKWLRSVKGTRVEGRYIDKVEQAKTKSKKAGSWVLLGKRVEPVEPATKPKEETRSTNGHGPRYESVEAYEDHLNSQRNGRNGKVEPDEEVAF